MLHLTSLLVFLMVSAPDLSAMEPPQHNVDVDVTIPWEDSTVSTETNADDLMEGSIENEIQKLADRIRDVQLPILENTRPFQDKIDSYMFLFNQQNSVRESCDCDGRRNVSPCPKKCLYSCYFLGNKWEYSDSTISNDCRNLEASRCYCSSVHFELCGDNMENCIDPKSKHAAIFKCAKSQIPDDQIIVESVNAWVNLIVEPIRKKLRSIESKLKLNKQVSKSGPKLSFVMNSICHKDDNWCLHTPEMSEDFESTDWLNNLALELAKTQRDVLVAAGEIWDLQERAIGQVVSSLQAYACCLDTHNNNTKIKNAKCPE